MIKRLRRQYPLHEHYEEIEGEIMIRQDVVEAREFFNIDNGDFASDWNEIGKQFKQAFETLLNKLSE